MRRHRPVRRAAGPAARWAGTLAGGAVLVALAALPGSPTALGQGPGGMLPAPPGPPGLPGLPGLPGQGPSGPTGPTGSTGPGGDGGAPSSPAPAGPAGPSGPGRPAGSGTPSLRTQFGCYLLNRRVKLVGRGFAPGARYTVLLDARPLGVGRVRGDGALGGVLNSGRVYRGARHQRHVVSVTDGVSRASTTFETSRFAAFFAPSAGNPRSLLVRFSAYAFGPNQRRHPHLYVHYLGPDRRVRLTVSLGRTHGACGSLPRTRQRHLFPFAAGPGSWRLQFDTRPRYSASSRPRFVHTVRVR